MPSDDASDFDQETLAAVGQLIARGRDHGIGVTFMPVPDGWEVGWLAGHHGGWFVEADTLGEAAIGAVEPLDELAVERARTSQNR